MLKYNQLRVGRYNLLGKIRYNSQPPQRQQPLYSRLSNALLVVYDQEGKRLGVLENADDPILEQEIGSVDTLTFSLPYNDPKREYIQNENIIEVVNQRYFVRDVSKVRAGGRLELVVYCEATWYDLQYTEPMKVWSWQDATPEQIMADILDGVDSRARRSDRAPKPSVGRRINESAESIERASQRLYGRVVVQHKQQYSRFLAAGRKRFRSIYRLSEKHEGNRSELQYEKSCHKAVLVREEQYDD